MDATCDLTSSSVTVPSGRPSVNARPPLVVARALKPRPSRTLAEPASQGLGITNASPWCSAAKASPFSCCVATRRSSHLAQSVQVAARDLVRGAEELLEAGELLGAEALQGGGPVGGDRSPDRIGARVERLRHLDLDTAPVIGIRDPPREAFSLQTVDHPGYCARGEARLGR